MNRVYRYLCDTPLAATLKSITATEEGIEIRTGTKYSDGNDVVVYLLIRGDTFVLTDLGGARAFMDKIFELSETDVRRNIVKAGAYYNVDLRNQQISVPFTSLADLNEALFRVLLTIDFLDHMQVFFQ